MFLFKLGPYLAGLIEGDGTIYIPPVVRDNKNRLKYPSIRICFNYNDLNLVEHLKKFLGGTLLINKNKTFIVYSIQKKEEVINVVNLINGYMRTPKIEALNRLIVFINDNYLLELVLKPKPLDNSNFNTNGWLSGFSDADGNFNINISKRKGNNHRIQLAFRIELRQLYGRLIEGKKESYFELCQKIASFFNVSLYTRTRIFDKKEFLFYLIIAHNFDSYIKVCEYFDKYPLLSSKYLNYMDWSYIVNLQKNKQHLTAEGSKKCIEIKNRFNKKRVYLSWTHLELNFNKLLK